MRPIVLLAQRTLLRHPWQTILMIIGITLGVAVVVAIDLANEGARQGFDLSTEAIAGRATHQIIAGPQGLPETEYAALRGAALPAGAAAAPIISEYVTSPQLGDRPLQLLGVDPFAEAPFRDYVAQSNALPVRELGAFLTHPGALLISGAVAERYSLSAGEVITLTVGGYQRPAFVAGLLQPADSLSARALEGVVLADISTAQELTDRLGRLDRIDLLIPEEGETTTLAQVSAALNDPAAQVTPVAARSGTIEQMTAAFRTNLTALSLLALVVGIFLIYNTMTFSVVQRRPLFGTLRCLGVTRRELFSLVLGEALAVGLVGSVLGVLLGAALGQDALRAVTQTINDLYFVLNVRGVALPIGSVLKGLVLGIGATVLAAAPPAWESASTPPRMALSRAGLEDKAAAAIDRVALASLALMLLGAALLALPVRSLATAFAGAFVVLIAIGMQTPWATRLLMRALRPLARGVISRMAPRSVVSSLSRTAIAIAALMVAISVTIGVSLMVGSFRATVISWLAQTVVGDVYISSPGATATNTTTALAPAAEAIIRAWPGVTQVATLRTVMLETDDGPVQVAALDTPQVGVQRRFKARSVPAAEVWQALQGGAVIVSEPYAERAGLPRQGGAVTLLTPQGPRAFPVAGIFYDYTSSQGVVIMALPVYRALWDDATVTGLALHLAPDGDPDAVTHALQDALAPIQSLDIRPNQALRDEALAVFDRTFAITGALQLLATLVAFMGVLSALLSLLLDKQRELGILRALGLSNRQLWQLIALETGLMGGVAGLLAMPTGFVLALILIYIINQRSFGWTLQLQVTPAPFVQALLVGVVAALLAGIYPAYRLTHMAASDAMRYE